MKAIVNDYGKIRASGKLSPTVPYLEKATVSTPKDQTRDDTCETHQ